MNQQDELISEKNGDFNLIKEICRKGVHLSVLLIPLGYHYLAVPLWMIQLILFGVLCFFIPMEIYRLKINPSTFINFITRSSEKDEPANYVLTTAIWLIILLGVNIFYSMKIAELALIATVIGDSIAAVIGRGLGKRTLPFTENKTIEGFVAGTFSTYLVGVLFLALINEGSFTLPLIPMFVWAIFDFFEDLPWYHADNIYVPTLSVLSTMVLGVMGFTF
ncbi:MAG: diacylglycerol/polyprenol kinase family protein [Candidatus Hodarchaeales archaeon]